MGEGKIVNPNVLRGVLSENNDGQAHGEQTLTQSTFIVRYPYVAGMRVLGLLDNNDMTDGVQSRSARSLSSQASAPKASVDLLFSNLL